jgi:hypothetical protein
MIFGELRERIKNQESMPHRQVAKEATRIKGGIGVGLPDLKEALLLNLA